MPVDQGVRLHDGQSFEPRKLSGKQHQSQRGRARRLTLMKPKAARKRSNMVSSTLDRKSSFGIKPAGRESGPESLCHLVRGTGATGGLGLTLTEAAVVERAQRRFRSPVLRFALNARPSASQGEAPARAIENVRLRRKLRQRHQSLIRTERLEGELEVLRRAGGSHPRGCKAKRPRYTATRIPTTTEWRTHVSSSSRRCRQHSRYQAIQ